MTPEGLRAEIEGLRKAHATAPRSPAIHRLAGALLRVLEIHKAGVWIRHKHPDAPVCLECHTLNREARYPCPTVRALCEEGD